jgi:hypothetical protein
MDFVGSSAIFNSALLRPLIKRSMNSVISRLEGRNALVPVERSRWLIGRKRASGKLLLRRLESGGF